MSFYEDLGVRRGAAADEIREQYRVLVRLFHPDQFADPALKAAAERQLRRFNEMEAVLCDPEQRRSYDSSLFQAHAGPPVVIQSLKPVRRIPWGSLAWGAAAMACAGAIVWVSDHETPSAPATQIASAPPPRGASLPAESDVWRLRARQAIAERDQALREVARLKGETSKPRLPRLVPQTTLPVASASVIDPLPAPPPLQSTDSRNPGTHFAGVWFYNTRSGSDKKLYAPEFIETQITERDGQVRGRYRSRYRVTDRAISPSVNFEFSGQASGTSAQIPFIRDDGAKGEVHLRLISDRELELGWTAIGSGSPSLTSGTAVLIRAQ
jgi:curved DNA-binding protein CbpA